MAVGSDTYADDLLRLAGETNLGAGLSYLVGDSNLDGIVDLGDFFDWNAHAFTATSPPTTSASLTEITKATYAPNVAMWLSITPAI